jgi:hypothetical protein
MKTKEKAVTKTTEKSSKKRKAEIPVSTIRSHNICVELRRLPLDHGRPLSFLTRIKENEKSLAKQKLSVLRAILPGTGERRCSIEEEEGCSGGRPAKSSSSQGSSRKEKRACTEAGSQAGSCKAHCCEEDIRSRSQTASSKGKTASST